MVFVFLHVDHDDTQPAPTSAAAFLFLYFLKTFFTEIYFQFHNLQFYTPTARQGAGWGPAAPLPAGRRAAGSPFPQHCSSGPLDVVLDILDTNKNH